MTERHQKTADLASFKADESAGEFEAIVSVFGNVDHGGDRVMPGAFAKSLSDWADSGDPIPVLWNHDRANPQAHIGKVTSAEEVMDPVPGLKVKGTLDLHKPFARQVYDLLSERRVKEFSFAYEILDAEQKDDAFELKELKLVEVGPTLQGMNPATQLLAVKSLAAAEKAGARLSKATTSTISQAIDLLASLIAADEADEPKSNDGQTDGEPQGQTDGAPSDPDSDLTTRIKLLKENI